MQALLSSESLKRDLKLICDVKEDSLLGKTFIRLSDDKLKEFLITSISRLQTILDEQEGKVQTSKDRRAQRELADLVPLSV